MVMIVECESCHSRFRVKKTLLKGAFAIRFRCRSCGGSIVLRNPEMPANAPVPLPAPPPLSVAPSASPIPSAPFTTHSEPDSPVIGILPPEPAVPPEPAKADPLDLSAPEATRIEDLVPYAPADKTHPDRDIVGGTGAVMPAAPEARSTNHNRRAWAIGTPLLIAGVGILLLAIGASWFGASNPGGRSPGREYPLPGSSSAAYATSNPAYDVQNLDSYILREAIAGNLFVITGKVKNVGKAQSRGIRVRATLFGKNNKVLMEQSSIAGNYIEKFSLPHMMQIASQGHLAGRSAEGTGNCDIPPGNSLPFVVVCFDPPGKVEKFKVLATDAEP